MKEYQEGKRAYINCVVVCPYKSGAERENWISGWNSMYYSDKTPKQQIMNAKWHASMEYWGL